MDAAGGVGMSKVEWVVVGVCVVVGNEGRKVGDVVYVEDGDGVVKNGRGCGPDTRS